MTSHQIKIGNELLKFISTEGQANTDYYYHHLTEECGFDSSEDFGQIGLVKAHLLRFKLIESLGEADYFFALTPAGTSASIIGIEQWLKIQSEKQMKDSAHGKTMTQKEKKTKVLRALYEKKFDGKFYNLRELADTSNWNEAYQIGKSLQDDGLIKMVSSRDSVDGEITSDGIELIEKDDSAKYEYIPTDRFSARESEIMKDKLDQLGERISKMEVGQQITYDDLMAELEELKKLLAVLGKKNWQETLKGKLLDAGLGTLTGEVGDLLIGTFKHDNLLNS